MEIAEHIARLAEEGGRLAEAATRAGLAAAVPSCPEWTVGDLLRHIGGVHRWATDCVRTARPRDSTVEEDEAFFAAPGDDVALDWFREGHAALVEALRQADPAAEFWHFLPAPSALAFWARRQAHETTVHRVDAELAGGLPSPIPARFAADGLSELLEGFYGRPTRLRSEFPPSLAVESTDTGDRWLVEIGPDGCAARRGDGRADCTLHGPAGTLYCALWNRIPAPGTAVRGDTRVLELWRERARVRWS